MCCAKSLTSATLLQAADECRRVADMGLTSKVLTHTRCHMHDVRIAVDSGVDGVNVYMATSAVLRKHSHGKGIDAVIEIASEVIEYIKAAGLQVRFSCEDTFRSDMDEILSIYRYDGPRSWLCFFFLAVLTATLLVALTELSTN